MFKLKELLPTTCCCVAISKWNNGTYTNSINTSLWYVQNALRIEKGGTKLIPVSLTLTDRNF